VNEGAKSEGSAMKYEGVRIGFSAMCFEENEAARNDIFVKGWNI